MQSNFVIQNTHFVDAKRCSDLIMHQGLGLAQVSCTTAAEFEAALRSVFTLPQIGISSQLADPTYRISHRIESVRTSVAQLAATSYHLADVVLDLDRQTAFQSATLFSVYRVFREAEAWLKTARASKVPASHKAEHDDLIQGADSAASHIADSADLIASRLSRLAPLPLLGFIVDESARGRQTFLGAFTNHAFQQLPRAYFDDNTPSSGTYPYQVLLGLFEIVKAEHKDPIALELARFLAMHDDIFESAVPANRGFIDARNSTIQGLVGSVRASSRFAAYSRFDLRLSPAQALLALDPEGAVNFIEALALGETNLPLSSRVLIPLPASALWCADLELAIKPDVVSAVGHLIFKQALAVQGKMGQEYKALPTDLPLPLADTFGLELGDPWQEACLREFLRDVFREPRVGDWWVNASCARSKGNTTLGRLLVLLRHALKLGAQDSIDFLSNTPNWEKVHQACVCILDHDQLKRNTMQLTTIFCGKAEDLHFFVAAYSRFGADRKKQVRMDDLLRHRGQDELMDIARKWARGE